MGARVSEVPLKKPLSINDLPSQAIDDLLMKWMARGYNLNECQKLMSDHVEQADSLRVPNRRKQRSMGMVELPWGRVSGINPVCMDTSDPETIRCGLLQRLMRIPPMPERDFLAQFSRFVGSWVKKNITPVKVLTFEDWLSTTHYNEHRKQQLRDEYDMCHGTPTRKQCHTIKTHVKREDYPMYKHARTINSRSDAFKTFAGPIFKSIETELYKHPFFVKHMTPEERADRIANLNTTGMNTYASDYTAFESHFTRMIQESCEMQLYAHCLKNYPKQYHILHDTLVGRNALRTRSGVRAKVLARRMSGEMNTSLGNGFTNLMIAMFLCQVQHAHCFDAVIEGDDALIVTDATLNAQMYERLGFTIKLERVSDPCSASFCGLIFTRDRETIKDPVRFMQHFGWTESYMTARVSKHMQLLHAKALSSLHELPQCPLIGAVCRYALKISANYPALFTDQYKKRLYDKPWVATILNPTLATRTLFASKFGVSIADQLRMESSISKGDLSCLSSLAGHPDLMDYGSRFVEPVLYVG